MEQTDSSTHSAQEPSGDIIFACAYCSASFVVDSAAAGMTLKCQKCGNGARVPKRALKVAAENSIKVSALQDQLKKCGNGTRVPEPALEVAAENSIKVSDLQHQLKENESQRTEITGTINQLNIQLHRWQLRFQTLKARQEKLQAEMAAICPTSNQRSGT